MLDKLERDRKAIVGTEGKGLSDDDHVQIGKLRTTALTHISERLTRVDALDDKTQQLDLLAEVQACVQVNYSGLFPTSSNADSDTRGGIVDEIERIRKVIGADVPY